MMNRNAKFMFRRSMAGMLAVATALGLGFSDNAAATLTGAAVSAQAGETVGESTGLIVTDVTYGSKYVSTKATGDDTQNSPSASSNITSVTLSDGTVIQADSYGEGEDVSQGVLTLVVDGVQHDILDYLEHKTVLTGDYAFESTAGSVAYSEMAKFGNMGGNTAQYTYRSALMLQRGAVNQDETILSLLKNAQWDSEHAVLKDGTLKSDGGFFNGIIAEDSDLTISNMEIQYSGDGANDFQGEGAAVLATTSDAHSQQKGGGGGMPPEGGGGPDEGGPRAAAETADASAAVNIESSEIYTSGVIRTAAAAKGNGKLKIDDSVIYTEETKDTQAEYDALVVPMMKRTPFALGIEGVVRATNVLGSGQGIYKDSLIVSSGWGVLSTDSGASHEKTGVYALDVDGVIAGIGSVEAWNAAKKYDAVFTQDQGTEDTSDDEMYGFTQEGSGYVAYADSGVWDKFHNVNFYSDDYIQIMASNKSSAYYTDSNLVSGRIAVMTQQNAGGTISIKDSDVYAEDTVVQVKSGKANAGYTNVELDNADITLGTDNKWGGTLVELVESDDAGNPGNTSYTIEDSGDSASSGAAMLSDTNAVLKNGTYSGNIWNNIYNKTEALNVTVDSAELTGTISSSYGYHVGDDGNRLANGTVLNACTSGDYRKGNLNDYKKIGAQYNVANEQINNPVNVTLKNDSVWNIRLADGSNGEADAVYVNDVTVEAGSKIQSDKPVTVYYYGTYNNQGAVSDNITFVKSEVKDSDAEDTGIVATGQFYSGTKVAFKVVDENGSPASKLAGVDYKAFTDIGFSVKDIADGYEIERITSTANGFVTEGNSDGFDYTLAEGSTKEDVTVTIQLKRAEQEDDNTAAAAPVITVQPKSSRYTVGARAIPLSVTAKSTDGGTISYQWYKNSVNSVYGGDKIYGADKNSYTPETAAKGDVYYYCVVKNTRGGSFQTVRTNTAKITVAEAVKEAAAQKITGTSSYTKSYKKNASFTLNTKAKTRLSYSSDNKKVAAVNQSGKVTIKGIGTAKITVKAAAADKYKAASRTITVKVNPAKGSIKKAVSVKKGQLRVTWKRDSMVTGYKIQYSLDKKFKKGVQTVTVSRSKTVTKTITKKLKRGRRYYVRVAGYKKVSHRTYTGAYSKTVLSGKIR